VKRLAYAGVAVAIAAIWSTGPLAGQGRQGLMSLPEGRIFYEVVGSGDPIVVIHGGPGLDHNYLRPGLDVLAQGHTLVYYDQRGTGRSAVDLDSAAINIDSFVEDIEGLREVLGYERITLLAHSFGGLIGIQYALRHPDRTRALILMSSVEPGGRWRTQATVRQQAARTEADSVELAGLLASDGFAERAAPVMSQIYRVSFRSTLKNPDRVGELNLDLSSATAHDGPEVARLLGTSLGTVDWWDDLPGIDVPTLVVHGRYDPTPPAAAREMAEAFPQGKLVMLDTGHFPFVEDPSALLAAVSAFLTGVPR